MLCDAFFLCTILVYFQLLTLLALVIFDLVDAFGAMSVFGGSGLQWTVYGQG